MFFFTKIINSISTHPKFCLFILWVYLSIP